MDLHWRVSPPQISLSLSRQLLTLFPSMTGESGSAHLRAKTITLGTMGNACAGLVFTSVLPYLLDADQANLGPKTGPFLLGSLARDSALTFSSLSLRIHLLRSRRLLHLGRVLFHSR